MSAHPPSHGTRPPSPLPSGTPSAEGVDALGVLAFLDAVEAAEAVEPHSLMILRHGRLVASGWWEPYASDRLHLLYSLSKSFTSTAAGFAVAEGLIGLDDPVVSYFPEFEAEITDPRSRAVLVRHVAAMASGHEEETYDRAHALDRDDLVRGFLLLPPERDPGSVFAYNQPATYALAAIVQRVTGQSLTAYLRPRLLDPLGVGEVAWLTDRSGRELGFSGLHGTTDTIARLGQLWLDEGTWQGSGCCHGSGSSRPPACTCRRLPGFRRTRTGWTGSAATASSSGDPGTVTGATAPTDSSAWSCPSTTP